MLIHLSLRMASLAIEREKNGGNLLINIQSSSSVKHKCRHLAVNHDRFRAF